jgi:hypothetical protein
LGPVMIPSVMASLSALRRLARTSCWVFSSRTLSGVCEGTAPRLHLASQKSYGDGSQGCLNPTAPGKPDTAPRSSEEVVRFTLTPPGGSRCGTAQSSRHAPSARLRVPDVGAMSTRRAGFSASINAPAGHDHNPEGDRPEWALQCRA